MKDRTEWMNVLGYTYKNVTFKKSVFMKKHLLLGLALAATSAASAQTVLESKTLPADHEMQVLKDQQGRIFKRLVKPHGETLKSATPVLKAQKVEDDIETTYYEGFEGWQQSFGINWIPDDWTEINTEANIPTEDMLKHNVNNTWFCYESTNMYQDFTPDGMCEAFIHFGYTNETFGLGPAAQDEWLISPVISLKDKETLQFILQADYISVYDCDKFDWYKLAYDERILVNTMKVMISTDGGENWGKIWDLHEDVTSLLTDREIYDGSGLQVRYFDIDLADYAGKDVKLAWRYVRDEGDGKGNSMVLDGIKITHPVSSAIHDVKTSANQDEYYDMNGVKINGKPSKKGLYIHKGEGKTEKVII